MGFRPGELFRKLVHIAGVASVPLLYWIGTLKTAVLFFALALGLYVYPSIVQRSTLTPLGKAFRAFGNALDFLERKGSVRYRGAIYFFASVGTICLLFPIKIAAMSIIVFCVGDGVSTLFGISFGKNKLFHNKSKSWEGSLSGFLASSAACLLITNLPMAVFTSFFGMLVESIDTKINDNILVPFTAAIVSYLIFSAGFLPV